MPTATHTQSTTPITTTKIQSKGSPMTLTPLDTAGADVVKTRELKLFLASAVEANVIPESFVKECLDTVKKYGDGRHHSRTKWGSRDFTSMRSLYHHMHPPKRFVADTTPRWIRRRMAIDEDNHLGFCDDTAGCL